METQVAVLHSKQVKALLDDLQQGEFLSKGEYEACTSKPTKVEKCEKLLEILKKKDGGIKALRVALAKIRPHGPNKQEETPAEEEAMNVLFVGETDEADQQRIILEKDNTILELRKENEELREEVEVKTKELEELKAEKDVDDQKKVDGKDNTQVVSESPKKDKNKEKLKVENETIKQLQETNKELRKEVEKLRNAISLKEQAMKVVDELEQLYPYIKQVLGCPVHQIPRSETGNIRSLPLYCMEMTFDEANLNSQCCRLSDGDMVNTKADKQNERGYQKYQGTTGSTPIIFPISYSNLIPPALHYWESHTVIGLDRMELSFSTLMEMGVCEEEWLDKMSWLFKQPRSWSVRVVVCRTHNWGICTQIWGNKRQQGLCFTHAMSNAPRKSATLCFGIVVDVGAGKVAFLDLGKERVLYTFTERFKETLYPVFGVQPWVEGDIAMHLMSGEDIDMTESKKHLINKALFGE